MLIQSLLERNVSASVRQIAETLKSECSEFLSNPTMLLRGIDHGGGELFVRNAIRSDRQSRSRRHVGAALFNAFISEEFGVDDIRSKCHFVTNSLHEAHKYGRPHLAFPVNGGKILSSPEISDSMNHIGEIWYLITQNLRDNATPGDIDIFMQVTDAMDRPGATAEPMERLFTELSQKATDIVQRNWDHAKDVTIKGYGITGVNAIPKYSQPVEYMVFNASHTNLVNLDVLAKELGTYDTGGAEDTFHAFMEYIENI